MKKRILFVDDEANVLNGLRRMLRSQRHEWDMVFVQDSQKVLDILAQARFDIIVTDIRMPGMDGVALLKQVRQQYPGVVRIVLSGQSSREEFIQSADSVHQYLSKPCTVETLNKTLNRAFALQKILTKHKLQELIAQIESLPCLPVSYTELMKELESEDVAVEKIRDIISSDCALAVKLLQLANSSYFGVRQHITSILQAITLIGLNNIKALVLTAKIVSYFDSIRPEAFSLSDLWNHSLAVGYWAQKIALANNAAKEIVNNAKLAGMLHDLGKLVFARIIPEDYEQVLRLSSKTSQDLIEMEHDVIGATHAQAGGYLLGLWGFNTALVDALTFHHYPHRSSDSRFSVLTAVHIANAITHAIQEQDEVELIRFLDMQYLERLGLADDISMWQEMYLEATPHPG